MKYQKNIQFIKGQNVFRLVADTEAYWIEALLVQSAGPKRVVFVDTQTNEARAAYNLKRDYFDTVDAALEYARKKYPDHRLGKDLHYFTGRFWEKSCKFHPSPVSLNGQRLQIYDHIGGIKVEGLNQPQWLYMECPKCGYQWSHRKLSIQ